MKEKIGDEVFDLNDLLHPADAFEHPSEVLGDPDLTLDERRAILSSWASDACALEASPELREIPRGKVVRFDDIMDALGHWTRTNGSRLENIKSLSAVATSSVAFAGPKAEVQLRNSSMTSRVKDL
jgi:hypothetical protein